MKAVIVIVGLLSLVIWMFSRVHYADEFEKGCERHIEAAQKATALEDGMVALSKAIKYAKENDLTTGHTSLLGNSKKEDVGAWYKTLQNEYARLAGALVAEDAVKKETLKKTKASLVIVDKEEGETKSITPAGISVYPSNWGFALWLIISLAMVLASVITIPGVAKGLAEVVGELGDLADIGD